MKFISGNVKHKLSTCEQWTVMTVVTTVWWISFGICWQGFYCESEKNFDDLCQSFRKFSKSNKNCMFEIRKERPLHLQYTFRAVAASSKHSGNWITRASSLLFPQKFWSQEISCFLAIGRSCFGPLSLTCTFGWQKYVCRYWILLFLIQQVYFSSFLCFVFLSPHFKGR